MPSQRLPFLAKNKRRTPIGACQGVVVLLFCVSWTPLVQAQAPVSWKSGTEFTKALQAPVGFTWSDRAWREGLARLAEEYKVSLWLDRRLDPDRKITFQARDLPLEESLQMLASDSGAEMITLGAVCAIVPRDRAAKLTGLIEVNRSALARLAPEVRQKWQSPARFSWDDLTQPRQLVEDLVRTGGARCENASAIPHDLWAAWQGPSLTRSEWLTLLLFGFDLTFELDAQGQSCRIIPIPESLVYDHVYAIRGDVVEKGKTLRKQFPELKLRREGNSAIGVTATADEHAAIGKLLREPKSRPVVKAGETQKTFTLSVLNEPRGAILKTLAENLGLQLQFAPELTERLRERVTFKVAKVTAEELLRRVLEPAKLKYERDEKELRILDAR